MKILKKNIGHILTGLPLMAVFGASFFPLSRHAQQGLMAFTLIWVNIFMIDILLGK